MNRELFLMRSERQRLEVVAAPMRLQIRRSRLANAPARGRPWGSMYIGQGRSQSLCQYRYVRIRGFNALLVDNARYQLWASWDAADRQFVSTVLHTFATRRRVGALA